MALTSTYNVCRHVEDGPSRDTHSIGDIYAIDGRTRQLRLFKAGQPIKRTRWGHYIWESAGITITRVGKDKYQLTTV